MVAFSVVLTIIIYIAGWVKATQVALVRRMTEQACPKCAGYDSQCWHSGEYRPRGTIRPRNRNDVSMAARDAVIWPAAVAIRGVQILFRWIADLFLRATPLTAPERDREMKEIAAATRRDMEAIGDTLKKQAQADLGPPPSHPPAPPIGDVLTNADALTNAQILELLHPSKGSDR